MHIGILGAGTMGHGIAQVSAMAGHEVVLRDVEEEYVEHGLDRIETNLADGIDRGKVAQSERDETLANLAGTTNLTTAVGNADLVIEAVPEDLELKQETLSEAEDIAPEKCVVASNTSSLSVTEIASELADPSRMVGLHFFNPVHIMPLVEIVRAEQTDESTHAIVERFVDDIDKTAVTVRDVPGFASSRLGVTLGAEAIRMLESSVASAHDIDAVMESGYNHPVGPLELTDIVGLDVRLDVLTYLHDELGERFRPPLLLKQKVRAGKLGKKTGEGFYEWKNGEIVDPATGMGDDE